MNGELAERARAKVSVFDARFVLDAGVSEGLWSGEEPRRRAPPRLRDLACRSARALVTGRASRRGTWSDPVAPAACPARSEAHGALWRSELR